MEIRFKDGKPLMVGGGLIAGSQSCCCENPPPPECYCPDLCSYFAEAISPLAVKSSAVDCLGSGGGTSIEVATEWLFPGISYLPGWSICDSRYAPPYYNAMASDGSGASVSFYGVLCNPENEYDYVEVSGRALFWLVCDGNTGAFTGTPAVNVYWRVRAERRLVPIGGYYYLTHSFAFAQSGGMVYPPTFCQYNDKRSCGPPAGVSMPPNGFRYINTPLTLELSRSSVSVNGSTQSLNPEDFYSFADASLIADFVSEIADAFTTTFRITSRPSCRSVPADCDVPLEGNRIITFGAAADRSFVLGTPKSTTTGLLDGGVTVNYEHYGTAGGTTADPWVFNAKRVRDEDNRTIEEHNVELFCGLDESVSPAVSRWYVREFTYCTPEFGQQTTGQWISVVGSYQAANDCNGIAVGDPVPIGSPDYEQVDGYPVVDFGDPCVPPSPIGLTITDLCP